MSRLEKIEGRNAALWLPGLTLCPGAGSGHRFRDAPLRFGALGCGAKPQAACGAKAGSFLSSQLSGRFLSAMPMYRVRFPALCLSMPISRQSR